MIVRNFNETYWASFSEFFVSIKGLQASCNHKFVLMRSNNWSLQPARLPTPVLISHDDDAESEVGSQVKRTTLNVDNQRKSDCKKI